MIITWHMGLHFTVISQCYFSYSWSSQRQSAFSRSLIVLRMKLSGVVRCSWVCYINSIIFIFGTSTFIIWGTRGGRVITFTMISIWDTWLWIGFRYSIFETNFQKMKKKLSKSSDHKFILWDGYMLDHVDVQISLAELNRGQDPKTHHHDIP